MASVYHAACTEAGTRELSCVEEALDSGDDVLQCAKSGAQDLDVTAIAATLTQVNPFTAIDLSSNELGAGAAASLKNLLAEEQGAKITSLDLSHNNLSEVAVESLLAGLQGNTTLRELRLSGNPVRGAGALMLAEKLQTDTSLQRLHVGNCEISTQGVVALATALQANESLAVLDISRTLTPAASTETFSHLSRMLKVNTSLIELDISKSGLKDLGLQLLVEELHRAGPKSALQVLRARGNQLQLVSTACVLALGRLLSSATCRLNVLALGGNQLRDEGALKLAEMVAENHSLLELDAATNGITSRGLCALGRAVETNATLQEVCLWGNFFDSAACAKWIQPLRMVRADFWVQEVDGSYLCVRR